MGPPDIIRRHDRVSRNFPEAGTFCASYKQECWAGTALGLIAANAPHHLEGAFHAIRQKHERNEEVRQAANQSSIVRHSI